MRVACASHEEIREFVEDDQRPSILILEGQAYQPPVLDASHPMDI
jgi:hypothetical protein